MLDTRGKVMSVGANTCIGGPLYVKMGYFRGLNKRHCNKVSFKNSKRAIYTQCTSNNNH